MSKSNSFLKILKNINKSINNLLEKNLNKLNFKNLINLLKSSKIFLTFVALFILFISYLSIPIFFKQTDISKKLENKIFDKFNLNLNFSQNIEYHFFPSPHFITSNVIIIDKNYEISKVEKLKINISLKNLFSLKKIQTKNIIIENAIFKLKKENYDYFVRLLDNDFLKSSIKINNSKIFYRSINDEVLFINKISSMKYYYDKKELKNKFISNNEIFNVPYSIEIENNLEKKILSTKLNINFLKLQIQNEHNYNNEIKLGSSNFIFNKLKSTLKYQTNENIFEFDYFDKTNNPNFLFRGKLNFKPFYSSLFGNSSELNLAYLFKTPTVISEILKTEILNNKNLNFKLKINANKVSNFSNFKNIIINSKIEEGLIDIDNSSFKWKNFVNFELSDSLIFVKNGELILDGRSQISITDHNEIYKFLVTPKNFRKKFNKINLNYTYNFDKKTIKLKDIKIDDKYIKKLNSEINNIVIKNGDLQNKIYFKKLLNKAIKIYSG